LERFVLARNFAQQPAGSDTPCMAALPLKLVGFAEDGLARSIEMLSLHAAVFGVGITLGARLMLVSAVSMSDVGD
jgi:hypothetical protein